MVDNEKDSVRHSRPGITAVMHLGLPQQLRSTLPPIELQPRLRRDPVSVRSTILRPIRRPDLTQDNADHRKKYPASVHSEISHSAGVPSVRGGGPRPIGVDPPENHGPTLPERSLINNPAHLGPHHTTPASTRARPKRRAPSGNSCRSVRSVRLLSKSFGLNGLARHRPRRMRDGGSTVPGSPGCRE